LKAIAATSLSRQAQGFSLYPFCLSRLFAAAGGARKRSVRLAWRRGARPASHFFFSLGWGGLAMKGERGEIGKKGTAISPGV